MMAGACNIFCFDGANGSEAVGPDRIVGEIDNWWVVLKRDEQRQASVMAAGLLVSKQHFEVVSLVPKDVIYEAVTRAEEAGAMLCRSLGLVHIEGQVRWAFNEGSHVQTVPHAHIHLYPQCEEDDLRLNESAGIEAAFSALLEIRLGADG